MQTQSYAGDSSGLRSRKSVALPTASAYSFSTHDSGGKSAFLPSGEGTERVIGTKDITMQSSIGLVQTDSLRDRTGEFRAAVDKLLRARSNGHTGGVRSTLIPGERVENGFSHTSTSE